VRLSLRRANHCRSKKGQVEHLSKQQKQILNHLLRKDGMVKNTHAAAPLNMIYRVLFSEEGGLIGKKKMSKSIYKNTNANISQGLV
jgi:hypothetical protein